MSNFKLDRIKFNWKNDWTSEFNYKKDDVVNYQGKAFVCLEEHTSSLNFYDDYYNDQTSETKVVTVSNDTISSQSQGKFYIDGEETPNIVLLKGRVYTFDLTSDTLTDFSGNDSVFLFSTVLDGNNRGGQAYNENVKYLIDDEEVSLSQYIALFNSRTNRKIEITVPTSDNFKLYYFANNLPNMGAKFRTSYDSYWEKMTDGFVWRGDWKANTFYPEGSIVKYKGYLYRSIESHTSVIVTAIGLPGSIDSWEIFSVGTNWTGNWATQQSYDLGDTVMYGGEVYICIEKHTSNSDADVGLEEDQEKWEKYNNVPNWYTDWQTSTKYAVNDVVRYGGIVYRCSEGHVSSDSVELGLEDDQDSWAILVDGIEYKQTWQEDFRYKKNDIVKSGGTLWKSLVGHTSNVGPFYEDNAKWSVFVPGLEYETQWAVDRDYQVGDIVLYGGYSYIALTNHLNSVPSINGELQDTGDWELLTTGFNMRGEYDPDEDYRTGDVVRYSGNLYVARLDQPESIDAVPNDFPDTWELIVEGDQFRGDWVDNVQYYIGDIVTRAGTAYVCIDNHLSSSSGSRPDLDQDYTQEDFWNILIQGNPTNKLTDRGDILSYDTAEVNIAIGETGKVFKVNSGFPDWLGYDEVPKVYYVGPNGSDSEGFGFSANAPFASVKYACEYILQDEGDRAPATVMIKTGMYKEDLPIIVPADVALVGDELRSTTIMPKDGQEENDMFYVRNGSGIRNMTLQGLFGTLGEQNEFLTRRPSAGAFVSLDPGDNPNDSSVWITNKSPYIQNVSTFGTGCIGMKVDGSLHNGGNRSIVANDFTQVLSDGIGYWADNVGRSELVSVFTYYCHIGYLCTNGGIVRATNGNNSYGEYGSVAEGFDLNETPLTASINNRTNDAQFEQAFTYGTTSQIPLAIGYSNAGQNYTSADITFGGAGTGATARFTEFRDGAITNIRSFSQDSSIPGGLNYTFVSNNAQSGNAAGIVLAQADIGTAADYIGQRILITSGLGVGQYGEITGFDENTKQVSVSRETDGTAGWEHFQPGWPIENVLDETTTYVIEPKVQADEPNYFATQVNGPDSFEAGYIEFGSDNYVLLGRNVISLATEVYYSSDGNTWQLGNSFSEYAGFSLAYSGSNFILAPLGESVSQVFISGDGSSWTSSSLGSSQTLGSLFSSKQGHVYLIATDQTVYYSNDHGVSWNEADTTTGGTTETWIKGAANQDIAVALADDGTLSVSLDDGLNWTLDSSSLSTGSWTDITYGNGRFVAVGTVGGQTTFARSFDGINWYESTVSTPTPWTSVNYGAGMFISFGDSSSSETNVVGFSAGGDHWKTFAEDSTVYQFSQTGIYTDAAYGSSGFIAIQDSSSLYQRVEYGARPILRAKIESSRLTDFVIYDPGSNYSDPTVTVYDNTATIDAQFTVFTANGVLAQPEYINRGSGYTTLTAEITGDGYAEIYQVGNTINVSNLTDLPGPGANLNVDGIEEVQYSIVRVNSFTGTGPYEAELQITPTFSFEESPEHGTSMTIRQRYSQIRLTGHDFLDIGTGNQSSTRYPLLYLEGESPANARQPFNETVAKGGGRVFYTSTDQDGNFRVGELFEVEQATGVVTVNASQFDLSGLTELALGGIAVGGSAVVIREFSKDPKFTADSNNIVPTQAAIKAYISSRISGGGSNANTNTLVAGQVQITQNDISTTSGLSIDVPVVANIKKGIDGHYLAIQYYASAG